MVLEKVYKFKANFISASAFSEQFSYSNCVMPISVGQATHEGERLEVLCNLVGDRFGTCTIIIADLLQRHTLQFTHDLSEQQAMQLALENGDQWLKRNKKYLEAMNFPVNIMRWYDWLDTEGYKRQRMLTDNLYLKRKDYRGAFDLSAQLFVHKYLEKNPEKEEHYEEIYKQSLEYIKEETSVMPLWVEENFHFEVYPSKRTPAMVAVYNDLVVPNYPNLLRWIRVNIRKKYITKSQVAPLFER